MGTRLEDLLHDYDRAATASSAERQRFGNKTHWIAIAHDREVEQLLTALVERAPAVSPGSDELLAVVLERLVQRRRRLDRAGAEYLVQSSPVLPMIEQLYRRFGAVSTARHQLLRGLAVGQTARELALFAELVASDPPRDPSTAGIAFSPLFQQPTYDPAPLFPRLLDAVAHLDTAALVLDLCNFVTRKQLLDRHPAAQRAEQLRMLLGQTVQQLACLEEQRTDNASSAQQLSHQISEAVSLTVSLCDALALIGDDKAIGKLNQALELKHRRLRTEAAAALAKLGDAHGRDVLIALAEEPVARLRVLAYAEELGFAADVDPRHKTGEARAEAELALWLSQPTQFGLPPSSCELLETRTQYWPSYEEPVACHLFRYTYDFGVVRYSNVGIVGPVTHTFAADLSDLPLEQIYAAYAGWQAEHAEIRDWPVKVVSELARLELVEPLEERLLEAGYDKMQSAILGIFFGHPVLVAHVERGGVPGLAVVDEKEVLAIPLGNPQRPLGPEDAYHIYKGRKLLRKFNKRSKKE